VLGARPDLDAGDRGPDDAAQGALHHRHRHAQHATGRPRQRVHRLSSTSPASAGPGSWSSSTRPGRSSAIPTRRRPRTTSPAASA